MTATRGLAVPSGPSPSTGSPGRVSEARVTGPLRKASDDPRGLREQGFNSFGQPIVRQAYAAVSGLFSLGGYSRGVGLEQPWQCDTCLLAPVTSTPGLPTLFPELPPPPFLPLDFVT